MCVYCLLVLCFYCRKQSTVYKVVVLCLFSSHFLSYITNIKIMDMFNKLNVNMFHEVTVKSFNVNAHWLTFM